ncbi:MAG: efflux RND transporter periplasmic adaptor subunit [Actinomycetota bacterium]
MEGTRRRPLLRPVNVVLVIALVVAAGAAYLVLRDPREAAAAPTTATVTTGTVVETVSASGTVQSERALRASFVASGTVRDVRVGVGDRVARGDVLATMQDTEEDIVRLKAPMAGTVSSVDLAVGQTVGTTGDTAVSVVGDDASSDDTSSDGSSSAGVQIMDTTDLVVEALFSETDASKLEVGQRARITFEALGGRVRATIVAIDVASSVSETNVVQYGVNLEPARLPKGVRPGQTATVEVIVDRATDALMVPSATVETAGGATIVTVLTEGQQTQVPVTIGVEGDQTTEILSGLAEGDQVVIPTATTSGGFPEGGFPGGGPNGGAVVIGGGGP